jgi:hypothetical protein
MAVNHRDANRVPATKAALNTDGRTIVNILADPSSHRLQVNLGLLGSDFGTPDANRDLDRVPVLLATSYLDGESIVECYADSNGNLLVTTGT